MVIQLSFLPNLHILLMHFGTYFCHFNEFFYALKIFIQPLIILHALVYLPSAWGFRNIKLNIFPYYFIYNLIN